MISIRAFTLCELLIAIAIVALLAAILFPIFVEVQAGADAANCLSNMRTIGTALQQYSQDNDQTFIKSYYGFSSSQGLGSQPPVWYTWRRALWPYAGNPSMFACPSSTFAQNGWWTPNVTRGTQAPADPLYLPASYAVNTHVIGFANGNSFDPVNLPSGLDRPNELSEPGSTIEFVDSRTGWPDMKALFVGLSEADAGQPGHYHNGLTNLPYFGKRTIGPFNSHKGLVNIAFCDGHAKATKLSQTVTPTDLWHSGVDNTTRLKWLTTESAEYK